MFSPHVRGAITMRTHVLAFSDLLGLEDVISTLPDKVGITMCLPSCIVPRLIELLPNFDSLRAIQVEYQGDEAHRDTWLFSQKL
jgi:hypothetical protein